MSEGGGAGRASGKLQQPVWDVDPASGNAVIRPRKGLLIRESKTTGRVAAFDELYRELAVATEVFLNKGDAGRQGVYDATCALMDYLTGQGIPFAALEPLIAVNRRDHVMFHWVV